MGELKNRDFERFCREYIIDHNGTKAAIRAGYSEHTAAQQASRLLKKPQIQERIEELEKDVCDALGLKAAWVVQRLMTVVDRAMQAEPVKIWDPGARAMVETGEYMFDSRGANNALEILAKHLGMLESKKVTVETGDTKIRVTLSDD